MMARAGSSERGAQGRERGAENMRQNLKESFLNKIAF